MGTISGGPLYMYNGSKSAFIGYFNWSATSNVAGNYSDVYVSMYIAKDDGATTSGTWSWSINIGGNATSGSAYKQLTGSYWNCGSHSARIYHGSDGKGSVYINCSATVPSGTAAAGYTWDGGHTITLETIPRNSSVSATSAKIGESSKITITRQSSSFTHTLTYSFKGETSTALTGTIASKTASTSVDWVIPTSFYDKIPNKTSGTVTITCTCYSGNTAVGTSTCTLTASVDTSIAKPTFNPTVIDTNSTTIALSGDSNKLIRYYSTAQVTSGATGTCGASIKSQTINNGTKSATTSPASFTNVETNKFTFGAYDTRGTYNYGSYDADMINYIKLTCYIGNNTPSADGTYTFTVKGNYFNDTFGKVANTLAVYYRWKPQGGTYTEWKTMNVELDIDKYVATIGLSGFDYRATYIFQAYATDKLGTVTTEEKSIKSQPVFDWCGEDFAFHVPVTINDLPVYTYKVLYDGTASGAVTLNDSVSNYDYIEVYYTDNNGRGCGYTKIYEPEGKTIHTSLLESNSSAFYLRHANWLVSGSSISPTGSNFGYVYWNGASWSNTSSGNYIQVRRVVGLKKT